MQRPYKMAKFDKQSLPKKKKKFFGMTLLHVHAQAHIGFGLSMRAFIKKCACEGFEISYMDSSWKNRQHTFFFFRILSLSGAMPLWKNQNAIWCMPYLMNPACWGFEISYMDSSCKNSWPTFFFFSCPSYLELWPFEKIRMKSCRQDISESIWARGLKLGQLIGDDE